MGWINIAPRCTREAQCTACSSDTHAAYTCVLLVKVAKTSISSFVQNKSPPWELSLCDFLVANQRLFLAVSKHRLGEHVLYLLVASLSKYMIRTHTGRPNACVMPCMVLITLHCHVIMFIQSWLPGRGRPDNVKMTPRKPSLMLSYRILTARVSVSSMMLMDTAPVLNLYTTMQIADLTALVSQWRAELYGWRRRSTSCWRTWTTAPIWRSSNSPCRFGKWTGWNTSVSSPALISLRQIKCRSNQYYCFATLSSGGLKCI